MMRSDPAVDVTPTGSVAGDHELGMAAHGGDDDGQPGGEPGPLDGGIGGEQGEGRRIEGEELLVERRRQRVEPGASVTIVVSTTVICSGVMVAVFAALLVGP